MATSIEEVPYGGADYAALLALRHATLRAPLGRDFTAEELARDIVATHLGAFDEGRAVGTLLVMPDDGEVGRLRQMAVALSHQRRGIGSMLMRRAEAMMRARGVRLVFFHARAVAIPFYARHGYQETGEPFLESTLPHVRMEKRLSQ